MLNAYDRYRNESQRSLLMRIELGHLPDPDLNPNKRLHYMALWSAKRDAKEMAIALVLEKGKPQQAIEKAHITITWVAKDKRRRDIDNLFASMKPYIDGLVAARLIEDDSAMNVTYTLKYERGDKNNTIIEVKEIKEHSNGAT
jgi:Holliday junction resolvase RusA-like endonuclease